MITGHVVIRNYSIAVDGTQIFSGQTSLENFLLAAYDHLKPDYPKFYKMDQLSRLGFLAAEALIQRHPLNAYAPADIAVVLSNNHSSLDTDRRYFEASHKVASPALFVYTLPNIVVGELCIRHKIKGENAFFVPESFDADLLAEYTEMLFASGSAQACLAGWVDVLDEHHDVLLYLIERKQAGPSREEADLLRSLYKKELWNN